MTKAVRIQMHNDETGWWADSEDVPGWTAIADTEDQLIELIDEAAEFVPFKPHVRVYGILPSTVYTWTD